MNRVTHFEIYTEDPEAVQPFYQEVFGWTFQKFDGGPIETPILSEQWKEYVALQLKMYASGDRRNDVYGRMREIASKLTPAEINGLATYYRAGFR